MAFHLVKRFLGSLSPRPPKVEDEEQVRHLLEPEIFVLWQHMSNQDKRHSVRVLRRFDAILPNSSKAVRSGVVLHDIGKTESNIGTIKRVLATIVGPRAKRFQDYLNHEEIGASILESFNVDQVTIDVVKGASTSEIIEALKAADNI